MSNTNLPPGFSRIDEILNSFIEKTVEDHKTLVEPDEEEIALRVKSQPTLLAAAMDLDNYYEENNCFTPLPCDLFLALKVAIKLAGGTTR